MEAGRIHSAMRLGTMSSIVRIPLRLPALFVGWRTLNSFSSNVAIVFLVKAISMIIGMATGIILARALGPAGKGSYTLITTFPAIIFCFVHFGIAEANVYFLRKQPRQIDPAIVRGNTLLFTLIISGFAILVLLILKSYLLRSILAGISDGYFYIIVLLIPAFLFETFGSSLLVAYERFKLLSSIDFLLRLMDTALVLLVIYVFRLGLTGVLVSFLFYFIVKCAILFLYGFRGETVRWRPDFKSMYSSIRFGLKSHAQSLTGILHYKVDIYILAVFVGVTEIGYYSIAVALVSLIFFIPDAVGHVMYPRVAALKDDEANAFTAQTCRNTLFITVAPAIAILLFGRFLIGFLYGQEYLPACRALYLLMPGTAMMCVYKILTRNFTSRNRQQLTVYAGLLGLATNLAFNLILIPKMGIAGAALATTVSYSVTSLLLLFFFLKESMVSMSEALLIKNSDIAQMFHEVQKLFRAKGMKTETEI